MSAVVHIVWKVEQSKEEEKIETFYFYDRRDTHCMKTVIVRVFFRTKGPLNLFKFWVDKYITTSE